MQPYELLEHTADAKFRAYGETLEEAFGNAIVATSAIATDPAGIAHERSVPIEARARDLRRLLFEALDQVIFLMDTQRFLPSAVQGLAIARDEDGYALRATLVGGDIRGSGGNLKAITYHEMLVDRREDGTWVLQAVVDI